MPQGHGFRDVPIAKRAKRNLPVRRSSRVGMYAVPFGFPPSIGFSPDLVDSAKQHRQLLISPIGLPLTKSPNPNRGPSGSFLLFDPAKLVRVSPQKSLCSFAAQRVIREYSRVCPLV